MIIICCVGFFFIDLNLTRTDPPEWNDLVKFIIMNNLSNAHFKGTDLEFRS